MFFFVWCLVVLCRSPGFVCDAAELIEESCLKTVSRESDSLVCRHTYIDGLNICTANNFETAWMAKDVAVHCTHIKMSHHIYSL